MTRRRAAHAPPLLLTALALLVALATTLAAARGARAGTEEFSTFDVEQQEKDDESIIDHMLTAAPREWQHEWDRSSLAFRTEQGCLTSGQWFMHNDLKVETQGERTRFGVRIRQVEDNTVHFDYIDLLLRVPLRTGRLVASFRPMYDKSRQDFGIGWEVGADTSAFQLQAAFGLEDMFNNLWAFRQTAVGNLSEEYLRHPWEPALRVATRHRSWEFDVGGKYLTPSIKSVHGIVDPDSLYMQTLWGTQLAASLIVRAYGFEFETRGTNQQVRSTFAIDGAPLGPGGNFRRAWIAQGILRRALLPTLGGEVSYLYSDRGQNHTAPEGPGGFGGLDRVGQAELAWRVRPWFTARFGGLFDRVNIAQSGLPFTFTYGTRNESRAYFGGDLRLGAVSISGVEGIELDPEPYPVWFHHDKGFLKLQTTF